MILTPIVSEVQRKIELTGGYYHYTTLIEVVSNITTSISRQCMVNVPLVRLVLQSYGIEDEYTDTFITVITTHLRKVSAYILDNIQTKIVHVNQGYRENEILFEITDKF